MPPLMPSDQPGWSVAKSGVTGRPFPDFAALHPGHDCPGARIMLVRLLTACLLVSMAGAAMAGPYEDGKAAYERGDYATAFKLWLPLAEKGNAEAQYDIGVMYYEGRGVPRDYVYVFAYRWFNRAAAQGNSKAAHRRDFIAKFMTPEQILEARYGGGVAAEGVAGAKN